MNLSQNSWIHHRNHHPAPALHHLLTSFSQRKIRSEFTLYVKNSHLPPKKKTALHPILGAEFHACCSWAMRSCSLQFVWHADSAPKKADAPRRLEGFGGNPIGIHWTGRDDFQPIWTHGLIVKNATILRVIFPTHHSFYTLKGYGFSLILVSEKMSSQKNSQSLFRPW